MRGHIRKRGKNSWAVVVDIGRDSQGKRKQKWFSGFRTKKEAEKALADILQKLESGTFVDPTNLTVSEYLERWLKDYAQHNVGPRTLKRYGEIISLYIVPRLGSMKLAQLRPVHLQELYSYWLSQGLSAGSVVYQHRVLHQALKHAVRWQLLARNPAEAVEPPRAEKKEMPVLTAEQVNLLLKGTEGHAILHMAILLAVSTGLRRGELAGLRWQDIDLENGTMQIKHTLQRIDGKLQFRPTKTHRSRRLIDLPQSVVLALRKHRKQQLEAKLLLGPNYNDRDFVLSWENGRPVDPDYLTHAFRKVVDRLGLPPVRFHDLRHTHATLLLQQGVHPKIVSERLGHSEIRITLDTYSHVIPGMQKEAAQKIDSLLAQKK